LVAGGQDERARLSRSCTAGAGGQDERARERETTPSQPLRSVQRQTEQDPGGRAQIDHLQRLQLPSCVSAEEAPQSLAKAYRVCVQALIQAQQGTWQERLWTQRVFGSVGARCLPGLQGLRVTSPCACEEGEGGSNTNASRRHDVKNTTHHEANLSPAPACFKAGIAT
jgi:hypothetical protein